MPRAERYCPSSSAGLLDRGQHVTGVDEFRQHLHEGVRRHDLRLDPELGEQERLQVRHQVQVQQPVDACPDQRVDLVAGGAVAHQAVRVHGHGGAGEDLGEAERRVDLDGLHGQLDIVVAQVPQQPQVPLPQGYVVRARGPAAGVEGGDGLVPGDHLVEAAAQPLEAGHLVQAGGRLRRRRVVGDQQDAPGRGAEALGVQGGGQCGRAVQRGRHEDLRGHAATPVAAGRRRSRRSRVARWTSMESRASSSTSCGIRRSATALIDFSFRATMRSNLSMDPK